MISENDRAIARRPHNDDQVVTKGQGAARNSVAAGPFAKASPKCQAELQLAFQARNFDKGEQLASEGTPFCGLMVVSLGVLELFKELPGGRREVVGFRLPGEIVAVPEVGGTWPVNLRAVTSGSLSFIGVDKLRYIARLFPEFDEILFGELQRQLANSFELLTSIGRRRPEEKLAYFLLDLFRRSGDGNADGIVTLPMNRPEIADYLGLRTETVCRILTRLKNTGLLSLPSAKRVVLCDRPSLEALSRGRPLERPLESNGRDKQ